MELVDVVDWAVVLDPPVVVLVTTAVVIMLEEDGIVDVGIEVYW